MAVDGTEVPLPVEVRSASMVAAQFLVDAGAAQRLVDPTGLEVVRLPTGRTPVALSGVLYADNDLGPYHELAVAFVVRPHDAGPRWRPSPAGLTTYIHHLPVNQQFTCAAGRTIWGFPKWVARIDYERVGSATEVTLFDDDRLSVCLRVRDGFVPVPDDEREMLAYSYADGVLRRTSWTTRNRGVRARPGGTSVRLGQGPVAEDLRALGFPRRAIGCMSTAAMSATFGAPEVIELPGRTAAARGV